MSSRKEPTERKIIPRSRSRQRLQSFDEHRPNLNDVDENATGQSSDSDNILDQSAHVPVNTDTLNLNEPQASSSQNIPTNFPTINLSDTRQALVPFVPPPIPLFTNFNPNIRYQVSQPIPIPNRGPQHTNFLISGNPIVRYPPGYTYGQFSITHLDKEYIFTNIPFLKPIPESNFQFISQNRRSIEFTPHTQDTKEPKMALFTIKDLVSAVPVYDGDEKQLETFINVCSKFYSLIEENQKEKFVTIIQTKITGEALADLQPIDDLKTWDDIKRKLEEKLRTPDTYEYAQEELSTIRQRKDEGMENYGKRIRKGLDKLNLSSKSLTNEEAALISLRKANEIHAIRKFEQNMFDERIKLMVGAATFKSLQEAIKFAMNKELFRKTTKDKICTFCKINGHTEDECRKKAMQNKGKKEQKNSDSAQGNNLNSSYLRRNNNNYFSQRPFGNRNENVQRYYSNRNYDGYNSNSQRNQSYSNQQGDSQRTNTNDQNYKNTRSNNNESNHREYNKNQSNDNNQSKNSGSQSNSRFDRNAPKNVRTIHEINSELEGVAITDEEPQASTSKN